MPLITQLEPAPSRGSGALERWPCSCHKMVFAHFGEISMVWGGAEGGSGLSHFSFPCFEPSLPAIAPSFPNLSSKSPCGVFPAWRPQTWHQEPQAPAPRLNAPRRAPCLPPGSSRETSISIRPPTSLLRGAWCRAQPLTLTLFGWFGFNPN